MSYLTRRRRRRPAWQVGAVIAAAAVFAPVPFVGSASASASASAFASVQVAGSRVIATGVYDGTACVFADGVSVDVVRGQEVTATVDNDCRLVAGPPVAFPALTSVPRLEPGGTTTSEFSVKFTVLEQFGVTATESLFHLAYQSDWRSGDIKGTVLNDSACYHSGFPTWEIKKCEYHFARNGPDEIDAYLHYEARNEGILSPPFTAYYEMRTFAQIVASGTEGGTCAITKGSLPRSWQIRCSTR